jgi:hypothetical protein
MKASSDLEVLTITETPTVTPEQEAAIMELVGEVKDVGDVRHIFTLSMEEWTALKPGTPRRALCGAMQVPLGIDVYQWANVPRRCQKCARIAGFA